MRNGATLALTVDLEEWHHGLGVPAAGTRVEEDTQWLLERFAEAEVTATFFALGEIVQRHPSLLRRVVEAGHELAFHGAQHRFLEELSPAEFASELSEWLPRLEDLAGRRIRGYRAPFFSVTRRTAWALTTLAEHGIEYDASIYPGANDRYGWIGAPRRPARLPSGLIVFPVPLLHRALPLAFSGGAYLRMLPWWVVRWGLVHQQSSGDPGMVYLHPWEIAASLHWARRAPLRANLTRHPGRRRMRSRLVRLLASEGRRMGPVHAVLAGLEGLPDWHV